MKSLITTTLVLLLGACAGVSSSQSIIARSSLNETTVGGPNYPIVVEGAESVGLTPITLAQSLRFPARLRESSFQAISAADAPPTHAHISVAPHGEAVLTFLHGKKRMGVGTFSLPQGGYSDPQRVGSVSAVLIDTMLREARAQTASDDGVKFP